MPTRDSRGRGFGGKEVEGKKSCLCEWEQEDTDSRPRGEESRESRNKKHTEKEGRRGGDRECKRGKGWGRKRKSPSPFEQDQFVLVVVERRD
jgi:hypothetical protein